MPILGTNSIIDISQHQGHPNFRTIKDAGIVGVIHKATEGVGFHDAVYAANKQAAKAEGLLWGAYHFGTGLGSGQTGRGVCTVAGAADDELLVLDYEDNNHGTQIKIPGAKSFVKRVFELTGRHPGPIPATPSRKTWAIRPIRTLPTAGCGSPTMTMLPRPENPKDLVEMDLVAIHRWQPGSAAA